MENKMTFERLAKLVADDFRKTMKEQGFTTFKEMKNCYDWDAQDIKDEVEGIITVLNRDMWKETGTFLMSDDQSFLQIGFFDEMSYGNFKKLVFADLK